MSEHRNRAATLAIRLLIIACGLSLAVGFFIDWKPHFAVEAWPGFYALFGFAAYCGIVLSAKQLRPLLRRDEKYYGDARAGEPGDD